LACTIAINKNISSYSLRKWAECQWTVGEGRRVRLIELGWVVGVAAVGVAPREQLIELGWVVGVAAVGVAPTFVRCNC
jgi:hypothetical protein